MVNNEDRVKLPGDCRKWRAELKTTWYNDSRDTMK